MSEDGGGFPCIVSDPAVFNSLLAKFLTQILHTDSSDHSYEFEDVLTLDPESYDCLHPADGGEVVALTFLMELTPQMLRRAQDIADCTTFPRFVSPEKLGEIKFMFQTVQNACGPVAILHSFANLPGCKVDTFVSDDPSKNAEAFKAHEGVRQSVVSTVTDFNLNETSESVDWHYCCIIRINGYLYELDGRLKAPVCHGPIPSDKSWVIFALEKIQNIVAYDPTNEMYNLQRLVKRRVGG